MIMMAMMEGKEGGSKKKDLFFSTRVCVHNGTSNLSEV